MKRCARPVRVGDLGFVARLARRLDRPCYRNPNERPRDRANRLQRIFEALRQRQLVVLLELVGVGATDDEILAALGAHGIPWRRAA